MVKPARHGNGYDPDLIVQYVRSIEELAQDKEQAQSEFMHRAKAITAEIKEVYDAAKESGIPRKELKAVVRTRELERKVEAERQKLEPEEQDTYDMIRHALGDFADSPLGAAALATR